MSASPSISRGTVLLLVASLALATGSWTAAIRWRPVLPVADVRYTELAAEADRLRGNTDAVLNDWRKRRDHVRHAAWTETSLATLAASLGDDWRWEWLADGRAALRPAIPQLDKWTDYLSVVDALGSKPGLIVEALEVSATGAGPGRRFAEFRLGVRFLDNDAPPGTTTNALSRPDPSGPMAGESETKPAIKPKIQ